LPALRKFYPPTFKRYWEPFLGSGAVFFDLHGRGLLTGHDVTLTDNNADLIACYQSVRDCPEQVIGELGRLAAGHARRGAQHYYEIRNDRFNPMRASLSRNGGDIRYSAEVAAMFIYLNRTGYNGLFRLNSDAEFNVPAGRYANPRICDQANLRQVASALARPGLSLGRVPFDRAVESAGPGDFLYFDPPYAPLSKTARFTAYTAGGFTADDQRRLRDVAVMLARRGCHVLISNSTAPDISLLYEDDGDVKAAGLRCHRIPARRSINSNGGRRGLVDEYLITNVPRY
jgi:DNA adenine methylase